MDNAAIRALAEGLKGSNKPLLITSVLPFGTSYATELDPATFGPRAQAERTLLSILLKVCELVSFVCPTFMATMTKPLYRTLSPNLARMAWLLTWGRQDPLGGGACEGRGAGVQIGG